MIWLGFIAGGIFIAYVLYWVPEHDIGAYVIRAVSAKLSSRTLLDEEYLISQLAVCANVPIDFAREYLQAVSASYSVKVGVLRITDNFEKDYSVRICDLPRSLRIKIKNNLEYIDGNNFSEFVYWEWYSERSSKVDCNSYNKTIFSSDVTIVELCRAFYELEENRENPDRHL